MDKVKKVSIDKFQVSARGFSLFRFFFGILMVPQVFSLTTHIYDLQFSTVVIHYPYLSFIDAYSFTLIDVLQAVSVGSAVLLALGLLPRISSAVFMLSFGYLFLIDMTFFNNHYYLWCLLAFLFVLADTDQSISVIDLFKGRTDKSIHIKNYVVFCLLISIVYLYAAIAKINPDWLNGQPMRLTAASRNYPYPDFIGYFLSYGGILYDGILPFFLWKRPKAWYVVLPYFAFHICNYFLFPIGIFPIVMMAAWLLYIPVSKFSLAELFSLFKLKTKQYAINALYILFFAFQIIFPLRFLLVNGNVAWHRQGYYFSWRMMLNNHEISYFQYKVDMPDLHDHYFVDFEKLVTVRQFANVYNDPYIVWQLAQKLKKDAIGKYKTPNIRVYCRLVLSLNGRPPKDLIVDSVDLGAVPYHIYSKNSFINY